MKPPHLPPPPPPRAVVTACLAALLAAAATPALAQISGGIDPVQTGRNALTLLFTLGAVLCAICWFGAGAACLQGRIPVFYFWAAGVGTAVMAGAAFISNRLVGGGGISI